MHGPDEYDVDDKLMDELGGSMDSYDADKAKPIVVEISIHPAGKPDDHKEPDEDDASLPTPDELEEMMHHEA